MNIYIWAQQGRLGNLIFQYQAIKKMAKKEDFIVSLDNEVFRVLLVDSRTLRVPFKLLSKYNFPAKLCIHFWGAFFTFFSKLRLFSRIEAEEALINDYVSETRKLIFRPGLFRFLIVVRGFFQNDGSFLHPMSMQKELKKKAVEKLNLLTGSKIRIGLHIRTTDYEKWSIMGKQGLILPLDWYIKAMELMNARFPDARYVVFTDDSSAAKLFFKGRDYAMYYGDSDFEDLVAMAQCDHLIISPSSFSLAAGLASYKPGKIIIAPKYWLGFKSREWFPVDVFSNKLEYLDIDQVYNN
jgi:hypothetical protein